MSNINEFLFIGAVLMFSGILLGASSSRFGIPFLLVFLFIGMLAGVDGIGKISFENYSLSFLIGSLALAVILLDGGLRTQYSTFTVALKPSLTLATFGVLVTAGAVGAFAMWMLDLDWRLGLLLGTIVGSTDAAAVFSLLRSSGTRLNARVANTLEIESGINDPMAIFLTITLVEMLTEDKTLSPAALLLQLLQQFGIGAFIGIACGFGLSILYKRVQVGDGLQALLLCSSGVTVFALTNIAGGSGFLAVYLVGLVVGNYRRGVSENVLKAMDGFAWLGQSSMFLLLGLLVTPNEMKELAIPALAISLFLMFVARPLAVVLCLLPFRFTAKELAFISWVGLRGAVPIIMAIYPYLTGVANAAFVFNVTFMVVLTSLVLQGTSIPITAKWFRVALPGRADPLFRAQIRGGGDTQLELVQFKVQENVAVVGLHPRNFTLPEHCRIVDILRQGRHISPEELDAIQTRDLVTLIATDEAIDQLSDFFHPQPQTLHKKLAQSGYGDFVLDGQASLEDVVSLYGSAAPDESLHEITLDAAIRKQLRRHVVEGDSVLLHGLQLTVQSAERGLAKKVGVKLWSE